MRNAKSAKAVIVLGASLAAIVVSGVSNAEQLSGGLMAIDSSSGLGIDSSSVLAIDSSSGRAIDSSSGWAIDSSSGRAIDSSSGRAIDSSSGLGIDSSSVLAIDSRTKSAGTPTFLIPVYEKEKAANAAFSFVASRKTNVPFLILQ